MDRTRRAFDPQEEQAYEEYAFRRGLQAQGRVPRERSRAPQERAVRRETAPARRARAVRRRRHGHPVLTSIFMIAVIAAAATAGLFLRVVHGFERIDSRQMEAAVSGSISGQTVADTGLRGYTNIALFGVDSRDQSLADGDNRSDSIMIASVNDRTGEVKLVSVYRDTLLDIGGGEYAKCNAAYAYGGPEQAVAMLNANLDLNITDFVTIGFEGLAEAIDTLGGIEIEITEEEAEYINMYVRDMHSELGTPDTPVPGAGLQTLNGIQATAYCRIRYTAGDDFKRANRQRTVLQKTFEKAGKSGPFTMLKLGNALSDKVATSLSDSEMASLMMKLTKLELADTQGFPDQAGFVFATVNGQDCVVPYTLSSEVTKLHAFLFGQEDYVPSEEVERRSEEIRALAGL